MSLANCSAKGHLEGRQKFSSPPSYVISVRLATHTTTKETFAIKVLKIHTMFLTNCRRQIIEKEKVKKDDLLDNLKKEVSILMMMVDHPNVVKLVEVLASKTKIYLVLEYIAGGELWELISTPFE